MSMNINISLVYCDINYISISLTPGVSGLTPNDFLITLNDKPFIDFTLSQDPLDTSYKIVPNTNPFSIYDEVYISLKNPNYVSNSLKVYISKYYYNHNSVFVYKLPECVSGNYKFEVTKVNGEDFNLINANNLVICSGINSVSSFINPDKAIYNLGEQINIAIKLIDINNSNVPDGKYVIKVTTEKVI